MDCADSLAMVLPMLRPCKVCVCYDGAAAVQRCETESPDVVILDLDMPILDGAQAASQIHAQHPTHPPLLVALSGNTPQLHHLRQQQPCLFSYFFTKPVDLLSLAALLTCPLLAVPVEWK